MLPVELQKHICKRVYSLIHPRRNINTALPTTLAQGMDGARYQVTFDPDKATIPLSFAFQKISEGATYKDTSLDILWQGVSKLDVRGGYHYLRSGVSWSAQVDNYLSGIKTHNVHALDLEGYGNTYSNTFFSDAYRWINQVHLNTDQPVVLYTNGSTYTQFVVALQNILGLATSKEWLDNLDLWIAYPSTTASAPPLQYKRDTAVRAWTFWQDNWNCTGCGCQVASDHDFFNGTISQLYDWAGVTGGIPNPPPTGGTMYEGTTNQQAKVWDYIGGTNIANIPSGTRVQGNAPAGGYAYITSPSQYKGFTKTIWLSNYKEVVTPPPPDTTPDPTVDSLSVTFTDGVATSLKWNGVEKL